MRRAADLEKLRMMDVERRRAVMMMDMMGEYGSKVGFTIFFKERKATKPL